MDNQNQIQNKKNWQERKLARELASKKTEGRKTVKKIGYWALVIAAVFLLGWWYFVTSLPKGIDYSESVPTLGRDHVSDGTKVDVYNSNPPTSGPHYPQPANAGFYSAELPDERVVHNLEHGNVWIAYRSALPKEAIDVLKNFAGGAVIVTPRAANDADIALAAWGRLDKFNLEGGAANEQRIKDFILRYQNKGPENVRIPSHLR